MNDLVRDRGQELLAAVWDSLRTYSGGGEGAESRLGELLACVEETEAQLAGFRLRVLREAQLAGALRVIDQARVSTRTTTAEARARIRLAAELGDRLSLIGGALCDGRVSVAQAEAMATGLNKLPARLSDDDLVRCQTKLLSYADELGPSELRILAARMLELIDPEAAEEAEAKRLERERRRATAGRSLRIRPDFHGSMRITGQLPVADGAVLRAQLDALLPPASSYSAEAGAPSMDSRRADALVLLSQIAAATGELPDHDLDRPHVHVSVGLETLIGDPGAAELVGTGGGEQVSAGEARRLACDANIIPVVLGGDSQPLDVGRTRRVVPKGMRVALTLRDQGCVFPHCTVAAAACEAHHIRPWWDGGQTSLSNTVLLCPRHHRLVEPDPNQSSQSQWQVQIATSSGLPVFIPPDYIDPVRRPRRHRRHILADVRSAQHAEGGSGREGPPLPTEPPPAPDTVPSGLPPRPNPIDDPWHPDYVPPHKRSRPPALRC